jgi:hypothetical protein
VDNSDQLAALAAGADVEEDDDESEELLEVELLDSDLAGAAAVLELFESRLSVR